MLLSSSGCSFFLESIGRRRGGSSVSKHQVASATVVKAAATQPSLVARFPSPSALINTDIDEILSQELLAAALSENWGKIMVGVGMAVAFRLPLFILDNDSVLCHILVPLVVILRVMSGVMLLIRDDMALPKRDKAPSHMHEYQRQQLQQSPTLGALPPTATSHTSYDQLQAAPTSPVTTRRRHLATSTIGMAANSPRGHHSEGDPGMRAASNLAASATTASVLDTAAAAAAAAAAAMPPTAAASAPGSEARPG
mmetsp:Transcript_35472/g.76549  ORF Transcript_35472/g.76549 Transcript_35472/m.76549 type:complete len:254 (-) Transcript_35472:132-893(-)